VTLFAKGKKRYTIIYNIIPQIIEKTSFIGLLRVAVPGVAINLLIILILSKILDIIQNS
jgi:hypothetical protein